MRRWHVSKWVSESVSRHCLPLTHPLAPPMNCPGNLVVETAFTPEMYES